VAVSGFAAGVFNFLTLAGWTPLSDLEGVEIYLLIGFTLEDAFEGEEKESVGTGLLAVYVPFAAL